MNDDDTSLRDMTRIFKNKLMKKKKQPKIRCGCGNDMKPVDKLNELKDGSECWKDPILMERVMNNDNMLVKCHFCGRRHVIIS